MIYLNIEKVNYTGQIKIGDKADTNYFQVNLFSKTYKIHKIIWIMHNDKVPSDYMVDHRIENLRLSTKVQNNSNSLKRNNTTSKYKGVYRKGNKWRAVITNEY